MKALTIALLLALAAVLSMAPNVHAAAAVFIDLFVCGMLDGNGAPVVTTDNQAVVTNNARGNGKLSCFADVTPSASGHAVHWDYENTGIPCQTPAGATTRWQEVVSASGDAILQCHTPD